MKFPLVLGLALGIASAMPDLTVSPRSDVAFNAAEEAKLLAARAIGSRCQYYDEVGKKVCKTRRNFVGDTSKSFDKLIFTSSP